MGSADDWNYNVDLVQGDLIFRSWFDFGLSYGVLWVLLDKHHLVLELHNTIIAA